MRRYQIGAHTKTDLKAHLVWVPKYRKRFWGRYFWARGYLAVSSGGVTEEMIHKYIEEQEGEAVTDDNRFQIDP